MKVIEIIREARGLPFLSQYDVLIESVVKVNDGGYEVSGTYKHKGLLGTRRESGEFKVRLGMNLEILAVKIMVKESA